MSKHLYNSLFFLLVILLSACGETDKKIQKHSVVWSKNIDSLLHHKGTRGKLIDSLISSVNTAKNDTLAIRSLISLTESWPDDYRVYLATEAMLQSQKFHLHNEELNAVFQLGYAHYLRQNDAIADSIFMYVLKQARGSKNLLMESKALYSHASLLRATYKFKESYPYYAEALKIATLLNDSTMITQCHYGFGETYRHDSKFKESEFHLKKALTLANISGSYSIKSACLAGLGEVYGIQGDYIASLDVLQKALKLAEENNDAYNISYCCSSLGQVSQMTGDIETAIKFFKRSASLAKLNDDKSLYGFSLSNLAQAFKSTGQKQRSLAYYDSSLTLARAQKEYQREASILVNMSEDIYNKNLHDSAFSSLHRALALAIEANDMNIISDAGYHLALLYQRAGKIEQAIKYGEDALSTARKSGLITNIRNVAGVLAQAYETKNNTVKALEMHKLHVHLKDSITNIDNVKKLAAIEYRGKEEKLQAERSKDKAIHNAEQLKKEEEIKQQRTIVYAVSGGLVLLLVLVFVIFKSLRENKKKNKIISEQKAEVEKTNTEIQHQKEIVEEKQKEILDSINYAKRIQYALLAHKNLLDQHLKEYFVMFKPKDIVSGDFYWATYNSAKNYFYLAVCDSTGHGVPGAFMSLLNISFLNEAINEKNIFAPGEVFNHVRTRLIENISHEGAQDGMDGILVCFDLNSGEITYAAANNNPVLIRGEQIIDLTLDKMPVGNSSFTSGFKTFNLAYEPGDVLFLYTDGFADQFGGPKGKKFKYSQLNGLLKNNAARSPDEMKQSLLYTFEQWRGDLEQVDDVCIIGIRI